MMQNFGQEMSKAEFFSLLGLSEYISIDLETTGLKYDENRITEIGLVVVRNGEIAEEYEWLVNPEQPIPDHIVRITGITDEMVKGQPTFEQLADQLLPIIQGKPIVGQNVIFDINFLEASFRRLYRDFRGWSERYKEYHYLNNPYYDTAYLARLIFPFFERHGLQSLAKEFEYVPGEAHRALEDAKTAAFVFNLLLENISHLSSREIEEFLIFMGESRNPVTDLFERFQKYRNVLEESGAEFFDWQHSTRELYNMIGKIEPSAGEEKGETVLLDEKEIEEIFSPGGILENRLEQFETRPQQIQMALEVTRALNYGRILSVEAGTGTGKSFAYLIPVLKWIEKNKHRRVRVVISTNTKNLQEQLFYKDLPLLKAILKTEFSAVLLKGKSNYLCLDRYYTLLRQADQRLAPHDRNQAALLVHWKNMTSTGDISSHHGFSAERNAAIWRKFIAEDKYCPGRACSLYDDCFIMKVRNAARQAEIVVVNHALLCSDLVAENSLIGPYDFLVVDEAHNLEKTAIDHLGVSVNFWMIREALEDLFNQDKNLGLLKQIENTLKLSDVRDKDVQSSLIRFLETKKTRHRGAGKYYPGGISEIRKLFRKELFHSAKQRQ